VIKTEAADLDEESYDLSLLLLLDQADGSIVKTFRIHTGAPESRQLAFISTGPNVQQVSNYFIGFASGND